MRDLIVCAAVDQKRQKHKAALLALIRDGKMAHSFENEGSSEAFVSWRQAKLLVMCVAADQKRQKHKAALLALIRYRPPLFCQDAKGGDEATGGDGDFDVLRQASEELMSPSKDQSSREEKTAFVTVHIGATDQREIW
jgi:hypothetical protein